MQTIHVNFTDSSMSAIDQYFGSPQDVATYPNFGSVTASDTRWKAFYDGQPEFVKPSLPAPQ